MQPIDDELARLRALYDGSYEPPEPPAIDLEGGPLFAGLARAKFNGCPIEITPGVEIRKTFAHVFDAPMVAVSPPPKQRAHHPAPWYALGGAGAAEDVEVEVAVAEGSRPFGLPPLAGLRLVASVIRLVSGQPVYMPMACTMPLAEARHPGGSARMIRLERPLVVWGHPVNLAEQFDRSLVEFLPRMVALNTDGDLARAFTLADGMWWLPSLEAQITTIWTAIEMLMRPGRKETAKQLGRAIRAYVALDRGSGDRLYQDVTRLYFARGNSAHAGAEPAPQDVQDSFGILRAILLRALLEGKRPPLLEHIRTLW